MTIVTKNKLLISLLWVLMASCASQNSQNARIATLQAQNDSLKNEISGAKHKAEFMEEGRRSREAALVEAQNRKEEPTNPEEGETAAFSKSESNELVEAFSEKFDTRTKFVYVTIEIAEPKFPSIDTVTYFSKVYEFSRWDTDTKYKLLDDVEAQFLLLSFPGSKVLNRKAYPFNSYADASKSIEALKRR